jgi:hypothetical protein
LRGALSGLALLVAGGCGDGATEGGDGAGTFIDVPAPAVPATTPGTSGTQTAPQTGTGDPLSSGGAAGEGGATGEPGVMVDDPAGEPAPEPMAPQDTTPEDTTPEETTPEDTTPEDTTPDSVDEPSDAELAAAADSVSGIEPAELVMLRQVCVDEINMYRATLSLPPLPAATPEQGLCSDKGAELDASTGNAHGSSGRNNPCVAEGNDPGFGPQNTCPGVRFGTSWSPTIADALRGCLQQMWDEGEPPGGREQCIADYLSNTDRSCFLAHGHYINMSEDSDGVACGFYDMGDGRIWMNQDFL